MMGLSRQDVINNGAIIDHILFQNITTTFRTRYFLNQVLLAIGRVFG